MHWEHPDHPGRGLRLAYCLNLHPSETAGGVLTGLRDITLPLSRRLRAPAQPFGVGMYLPWNALRELERPEREGALDDLRALFEVDALDPFTYNAFPFGGFHEKGLKASVFEPTWAEEERVEFTRRVAWLAALMAQKLGSGGARRHLSISTHGGRFGSFDTEPGSLEACSANFARVVRELGQVEEETGVRVVLSVEAEPRSSAGDTYEGARLLRAVRERSDVADDLVRRHLGTCLDTCHAAVEFEDPGDAFDNATRDGTPIGKLQFSSAVRLLRPDENNAGREALFGMAEPVFLHQVTALREGSLARALDLPEAQERYEAGEPGWRDCDEWRCHFHVPVDLEQLSGVPLETTRSSADDLLTHALAHPDRWGTDELHVEIETYTWDVLPGIARGPGEVVDGLEREYAHVSTRLSAAGWKRSDAD